MKKLAFAVTAASGAAAFIANHEADASTQHTVKSGESLWTISQQYGVSVEEIKQNNNINNNIVFPGQVIEIGGSASQEGSSSNTTSQSSGGTTHTVKSGESLNIIANNYGVTVDELVSANNLNGYIIQPNQTLTIPGTTGAGGSGGSTTQTSNTNTASTASDQNLYDWGQCTWHVFNRRAETGQPISTYWWNADHWANNAAADGYTVNNTPSAGSILQTYSGAVGHVAYVEQVNPDGSILISEMNYNTPPGTVDYRTIPASEVSSYNYIH
ncbi:LysM peptidoglycan-binding domain-containing protein [Staphylococcus succinus]|uniref:LysM peptidoglycan-binding domain-containing protein n=1 Tax=Staphylococcus succinus TaxID=61015 RepID=A0A9Q6HNA4_9STAP|nr:LysM peptidoglycan-binding domain-containing protein [Staphylococcus succinus]MEB8125868.1 LysM peptidoglycan-binding domain-containing protein [Staphylococcus succinus]MEB8210878.1 LysM peptidoglycan-binding domain-containing protein [Staphylococcus succinus]PTI38532.1 LysM peptidoglycan-binding domain-containing protein [Staphylococcus succinus]PTI74832.1 LysM peptidoglycan-binding domain-containing protein [Staphylococcus succinus]PTJ13708.1 LysM peptidoglycan-binding domain-containing p